MVSITDTTKHSMQKKKKAPTGAKPGSKMGTKSSAGAKGSGKRGSAPKLTPSTLASPEAVNSLLAMEEDAKKGSLAEMIRLAMGENITAGNLKKPRAASTTRTRSQAAADVAVAAKELGLTFVMKRCNVMGELKRILLPLGNEALFTDLEKMKKISSALSLASMDTGGSGGSLSNTIDSKRGKTTPAPAREGALLILRGLCEIVGKPCEPYVIPYIGAALDECGSTSGSLREVAEDTCSALVRVANPLAIPTILCPMFLTALRSPEWRVKQNALDRLAQCAETGPQQICPQLPKLIPKITEQVFDTKPQVTKAASSTLMAICMTNQNPDVAQAIPAVVKAAVKPADTVKAIDELMATTFVATVDASTLSILCPVLSRGLKERMALHKRAACIVIENMSRLVDNPTAVAPFGPLLVPELQKVAENVQFEEIRDAALAALKALTKALGHADIESAIAAHMEEEAKRVEMEQKRIEDERDAVAKREEELRRQEEEERRLFKEAMDAQRELDKIAEREEEEKKVEDAKKRDLEKRSTKSSGGKCQSCGLKKCKKTCLFYSS